MLKLKLVSRAIIKMGINYGYVCLSLEEYDLPMFETWDKSILILYTFSFINFTMPILAS